MLHNRSSVAAALRVADQVRRRKRRADGGDVSDEGSDPDAAAVIPDFPPAIDAPLIPSGPTSGGTDVGNRVADIASKLAYGSMQGLASLPQRAIENSAYSLDSGTYDPVPALEAAGHMMGGASPFASVAGPGETALGSGMVDAARGLRAWHGSPNEFDRFDLSARHGEPAEAYFSDDPELARQYGDHLYDTALPSPEHMLDLDRPLGVQSDHVKGALRRIGEDVDESPEIAGYQKLKDDLAAATQARVDLERSGASQSAIDAAQRSENDAAVALRDADRPPYAIGADALDRNGWQSLRDAGISGTRRKWSTGNVYSVFDDKLLDILNRKRGDEMQRGGDVARALRLAKALGGPVFSGYIHGSTGGRTDNKDMNVEDGSYVIPADVLSGLGEGNSMAGADKMMQQLEMGPYDRDDPANLLRAGLMAVQSGQARMPPSLMAGMPRGAPARPAGAMAGGPAPVAKAVGGLTGGIPAGSPPAAPALRPPMRVATPQMPNARPQAPAAPGMPGSQPPAVPGAMMRPPSPSPMIPPVGGKLSAPTRPVPIVAASGEMVVPPHKVAKLGAKTLAQVKPKDRAGFGSPLDVGHKVLDALVQHQRKQTVKTLKSLPKPKKD